MKTKFIIFLSATLLLGSCVKNKGKVTMTYNKATAVYADVEEIRKTPLLESARSIDNTGKIFVGDNFILMGETDKGIHVFDNNNPSNPNAISFLNLPFTSEFYVSGNYIYAESHYDLVKINIADIYNPKIVDRVVFAFADPIYNDNGEVLIGFDYAVTTESFEMNSEEAKEIEKSGSLYFDYQDKLIPQSVVSSSFAGSSASVKGTLNKITTNNNYVYVIGNSDLFVFQDGVHMNQLPTVELGQNVETIYPEGNNLFVGTQSSMIIVNASNPSSPEVTSEYNHPNSCDPVYPNGNVAYLTLRTNDFSGCSGDINSVDVLDISDLDNPEVLDQIEVTSPYGMTMVNNHLFVGEGNNGLTIFDASNPAELDFVLTNTNIKAYDILVHPTNPNLILTTGDAGLEQYQVDYNTMTLTWVSGINY